MIILEAEVTDYEDSSKKGFIVAKRFINTPKEEVYNVYYTSPWGAVGKNLKPGMYAIPSPQQKILIVQPDQTTTWYLLSVIHSGPLKEDATLPKEMYRKRDKPSQFILRDPLGNELLMSHQYKTNFNTKVRLKSGLGKKLTLNDSPKINHVALENEIGDGIKIRGKYQRQPLTWPPPPPARSIDIACAGMINMTSRNGGMNITVGDGKDLTLTNSSTGFNVLGAKWTSEETWARTPLVIPYGNINLYSEFRDVNIVAGKKHGLIHNVFPIIYQPQFLLYKDVFRGKILLRAKGAAPGYGLAGGDSEFVQGPVVQLASDGSIILKTLTGKIYLKGDVVNIRGDREVNIESRGNVNINAGDFFVANANTNSQDIVTERGAFGYLPSRPSPQAPDSVKQAYEASLNAITTLGSPLVSSPFASILIMGGPTGNTILDSRQVQVFEAVPRPIYQSLPRIPGLPAARKAETPPVILSDEEKQIV